MTLFFRISNFRLCCCEVPLREGAARTRLEIPLKENRGLLIGKFHRHDDAPGSMMKRLTSGPAVMPPEPHVKVAGYANIVTIGVALAAKNVNESLSAAAHTKNAWHVSRHPESGMILCDRSCRSAEDAIGEY